MKNITEIITEIIPELFLKYKRKFIVWNAYRKFPYNNPRLRMLQRMINRKEVTINQLLSDALKPMAAYLQGLGKQMYITKESFIEANKAMEEAEKKL